MTAIFLVHALTKMLGLLNDHVLEQSDVLEWASPVPAFGRLHSARVATVGINPSNREFVSASGTELIGPQRRFHTLNSLGLDGWSDLDTRQLILMLDSFDGYFQRNPYEAWFRPLDNAIARTGTTLFGETPSACHLDLVPFATRSKWGDLASTQRSALLELGSNMLGGLLRDSNVAVVVLNGTQVVREFEAATSVSLAPAAMPQWNLDGSGGTRVHGIGYEGWVDQIAGTDLGRSVFVLGFNINLQSSYGVTRAATEGIADWIGAKTSGVLR